MAGKFYAIKVGKTPGIYTTWDEAKKQIAHVSGAKYKSFGTREEAEAYLDAPMANLDKQPAADENTVIAYVDGSFDGDHNTGVYGSGVIWLDHNENEIARLPRYGNKKNMSDQHQIAGEAAASIIAIQWGIDHGYQRIFINYDYQGIASWAKDEWAANSEAAKAYKKKYDELSSQIEVTFVKVKAHTGIKWNEAVDLLAKQAVSEGIAKLRRMQNL